MITVIHERHVKWYREQPEQSLGFSSRAAYALGYDKPNHPVPAIPLAVDWFPPSIFNERWEVCIWETNQDTPTYPTSVIEAD